ncbi:hypothetical protein PAHAL_5G413000 [Panicum hallii]|jgi:hypothetical protein|uniref:Uncharacterized protein n=1 Tax=Panicum hallii TaxID=206008 RepID=A0A2T8IMT6_9POAL|nr:hypothetical protein PAHAL_5G413000 [Panicum hallii]
MSPRAFQALSLSPPRPRLSDCLGRHCFNSDGEELQRLQRRILCLRVASQAQAQRQAGRPSVPSPTRGLAGAGAAARCSSARLPDRRSRIREAAQPRRRQRAAVPPALPQLPRLARLLGPRSARPLPNSQAPTPCPGSPAAQSNRLPSTSPSPPALSVFLFPRGDMAQAATAGVTVFGS